MNVLDRWRKENLMLKKIKIVVLTMLVPIVLFGMATKIKAEGNSTKPASQEDFNNLAYFHLNTSSEAEQAWQLDLYGDASITSFEDAPMHPQWQYNWHPGKTPTIIKIPNNYSGDTKIVAKYKNIGTYANNPVDVKVTYYNFQINGCVGEQGYILVYPRFQDGFWIGLYDGIDRVTFDMEFYYSDDNDWSNPIRMENSFITDRNSVV